MLFLILTYLRYGCQYGDKTKVTLLKRLKGHKIKHCENNCWSVYDQLKINLPETFSKFFTLNN